MIIWRDIVIDYRPNAQELISVLSETFNVPENRINITDAIENAKFDVSVICILSELPGHFYSMLSFYLDFDVDNEILLIVQICKKLKCKVLISNDNSANPYSMLLLNQEGTLCEVKIDPDKLDKCEEYEILN